MTPSINCYNKTTRRFTPTGNAYIVQLLKKNPLPSQDVKHEISNLIGCDLPTIRVSKTEKKLLYLLSF